MQPPHLTSSGLKQWLLAKDRIGTSVVLVFVLLFGERILAFARGIVFARLLGTTEYGVYTLGLFVVPFMATVSSLGVLIAFGRYSTRYEASGQLHWFLRKTYLLTMAVAGLVAAGVIAFSAQVSSLIYGRGSHRDIIVVAALCIPALLLTKNLSSTYMGLKLFRAGKLVESAQIAIYAAVGIVLVVISPTAIMGAIGYALAAFASVAIFVPLLASYVRSVEPTPGAGDESRFYRNLLGITIWYAVIPVLSQIFHFVDRFGLERLMTTSDQGTYSAMVSLCETLSAIGLAVNSVAYPHLCATWERGEQDRAKKNLDLTVKVLAIILLLVGIILVVFGKWFILILLGKEYLPGAVVLPILAVFYLITMQISIVAIYPPLIEKNFIVAIAYVFGLPSAVAFNLLLIPRLGMVGAALATLLAFVVIWACVVGICWRFGLHLSRRTLLACLSCAVLLLPWYAAVPAVGAVLYACAFRTWILSAQERERVYAEIRRVLARAKMVLSTRR